MECLLCIFELPCGEHRTSEPYIPTDAECMQMAGMGAVCEVLTEREILRRESEERCIVAPSW